MKASNLFKAFLIFITLSTFSSCAVVGGIFKTGMGVGIIAVVLLIGIIAFFVIKSRNN